MAFDSILQTGRFTADGNNKTLKIRSDVDKIVIENTTQWAATNNGYGYKYTWYRDMGTTALMEYHPAGDHTSAVDSSTAAIELIDSSNYSLGTAVNVTGGTNVVQPVYTIASSAGLSAGCIVRLVSTNHNDLNGLDFTIDDIDNGGTNFRLANALATAPGRIAATGTFRLVAPNLEIYSLFTPGNRNIAKITQAANAVVTTLVDHGYAVGQKVKFNIPSDSGMTELTGVEGNVIAIANEKFTTDVDTTAMTAFKFPVYTKVPFTPASVIPVGDAKSTVSQLTPSKFYNQGYIGVVLTGGTTKPAGNNNDVIYWTAYKVERIDKE